MKMDKQTYEAMSEVFDLSEGRLKEFYDAREAREGTDMAVVSEAVGRVKFSCYQLYAVLSAVFTQTGIKTEGLIELVTAPFVFITEDLIRGLEMDPEKITVESGIVFDEMVRCNKEAVSAMKGGIK